MTEPARFADDAVPMEREELLAKAKRIADDGELIPRWLWQTIQQVLRDLVRLVEAER
ncbi:MAG TPA: hypothetical protein VD970_01970 [Acetobacteraceae bacterium]|nr:hypothetical protein [Acetobacteraceae bacterium]